MQVVGIQPFVRTSHFPHIRARRKGRAQILACWGGRTENSDWKSAGYLKSVTYSFGFTFS